VTPPAPQSYGTSPGESSRAGDRALPLGPVLGDDPGRVSFPELLREVATHGWNSAAGTAAVAVMQRACRREAMRWTWTAGWMTDEGLADTWEQIDRLMRSGRFDDAPGLLTKVVRRAYAGEAAAAQTGMGSASTRGLVAAVTHSETRRVTELDEEEPATDGGESATQAPPWMRTLAAVLAVEGWRWPMPPLHAVMASAACVVRSGRRSRSALAGHDTGVPVATWSALDADLRLGSGVRGRVPQPWRCRADRPPRCGRCPVEPVADADRPGCGRWSAGADGSGPEGGVMTLTAEVVADLHAADGALAEMDADSDVGFFSMSPASAEQVTVQIRTVLDRGWEYIALAYKGRAFVALGYPTWDAYVDARFGDFRIAVPREHRQQAVAALAGVRMSIRAIAGLLGVGVGTVHREMVSLSGVPDGTPDTGDQSESTLGTDGKQYPRRRRPTAATRACTTCGERHPAGTTHCPWDLFAQGRGPRPGPSQPGREDETSDTTIAAPVDPDPSQQKPHDQPQDSVQRTESNDVDLPVSHDLTEAVGRAEGLRAQIADLVQLVNDIQAAVTSHRHAVASAPSAARVRELASCLRHDITGIQGLAERLDSVADGLHPRR